ncbi:DUF4286 family protein [Arthrobacter sunyaminii]|uniref:EthD family reductase n=1 Tax=Arthrobacter sunyaminii TaxID=2816859 RepID=A0A975S6B4_9MICC|nr:DUF4286 family protein [Arthrobacter sunyaminii]MBO0909835.1 hypothetical protein [Arthrobacter sunyaminii]QWQ36625.1 hypothetical protein KG104_02040 [Arthrobacter sunyaminii]
MSENASPRQILLALVNPVEGRDEEFRTWYWETHIPEVLALPGFISAECFHVPAEAAETASHRYTTIYGVEGSATAAMDGLFKAGVGMSPDLDLSTMVFVPLVAADAS